MASFDDLIPGLSQSSGSFDDLVPPRLVDSPQFDGNPYLETALQGATLGLSDEMQSGAKAAFDKAKGIVTGEQVDFGERYDKYQDDYRVSMGEFNQDNPKTALAGELVGALAVPGVGGAKLLSKLPEVSSKLGNIAVKSLGLSGVGAAEGGIYGAGTADSGEKLEAAIDGAKVGAIAVPAVGLGLGGAARQITKRKANQIVEKTIPSIDDLKSQASKLYGELDDMGVVMSADSFGEMTQKMRTQAHNFGHHKKMQPKVAAALKEFDVSDGKNVSLKDVDVLRRIVGQAASSIEPAERKLAVLLIDTIDDKLLNLSQKDVLNGGGKKAGALYAQARDLWAKGRKSEILNEAIENAKTQASGFENGLRRQFDQVLKNKKKRRGFSADELKAMRRVVNGSPMGNAAKFLGKFGISERQATSALGAAIGVGAGASVGGAPGAIAAVLTAQSAKKLASKITQKHAQLADDLVRAGTDTRKIVNAYFNAPTGEKSAKELAALLINKGADLDQIMKSTGKLQSGRGRIIRDAASMASAIPVMDGEQ